MSLGLDLSRPFRSPGQLLHLVTTVHGTTTAQEDHWLEWKTQVDLLDRLWQAKTARFILGAANRARRVWEKAAGGCAYLLLGVEPGNVVDTVLPDPATLENGIRRYLGHAGPLWSATSVEVGSQARVVVVTVEPPEPGRRPYLCKIEYTGILRDGGIYIRGTGSTVEAKAVEVEEMLAEMRDHALGSGAPWALRLDAVDTTPLTTVDVTTEAVEEWLRCERERLTSGLLNPDSPVASMIPIRDQRSRQEYQAEVDEYLRKASERIRGEVLFHLSRANLGRIEIEAHNDGDDNLPELEVELFLPQGADAVGYWGDLSSPDRLPRPPRRLGASIADFAPSIYVPSLNVGSGVEVEGLDDRLKVTLPAMEVRPGGSTALTPFVLLIPRDLAGDEMSIPWRASSPARRGIAEGVLQLRFGQALSLTEALAIEPDLDDD